MSNQELTRIGDAFFAVEKAENLYEWKVLGVSVWSLVRSRLFKVLMTNSQAFSYTPGKAVEFLPDQETYKGRNPAKLLLRAVLGFPAKPRHIPGASAAFQEPDFRNLKRFTHIIVPFATRQPEDPQFEKFSQPFVDALGDKALVIGLGTWDKISNRPMFNQLNRVFHQLGSFATLVFLRFTVLPKHHKKWARVVAFLEAETGYSMSPYRTFPRWTFRTYFLQYFGYRLIFSRTSAKRMFSVNAARMPMQAAAQSLGIKVTEIQSGVFSKYSLQFSWPGHPVVPYIPNEILTWGEYWTTGIERAAGQEVTVIGSTAEFEEVRNRNIAHIQNQVVFLAQPLVGLEILAAGLAFARACPNKKVIFKLHPRNPLDEFEAAIAQESAEQQAKGNAGGIPANFVLMQEERSSLEVIAESEIAVGVFSTALIEAAGLGTKVGMLKLAGWEHLAPLVDGGYATLFSDVHELIEGIDNLKAPGDPYFFYGKRKDIAEVIAGN
ncbi:MAG: hypothetical protein RLZZ229_453 [Actinomycetota bacterium]|jgi:hypothetical protein